MERFETVRDIGHGNFGVAKLLRDKKTKELFAVKYLDRGPKVCLTPQKLAIVMEYAAGGELFERICTAGRFSENEARFFFQQLISGVSYCHDMQICHRDLKLENTLLDGSPSSQLKICDFGYSKSLLLHSQPKSTVGTPAYIAPEILSRKEYDGKIADVWSCGVTLYVMLVGAYPFEDPEDPKNFKNTINRILNVQYSIPDYVHISPECSDLLSSIFVTNPAKRITIAEIKTHPWFCKDLPRDLLEGSESSYTRDDSNETLQSVEDIMKILNEAKVPGVKEPNALEVSNESEAELEANLEVEGGGDFVCQV